MAHDLNMPVIIQNILIFGSVLVSEYVKTTFNQYIPVIPPWWTIEGIAIYVELWAINFFKLKGFEMFSGEEFWIGVGECWEM